MAVTLPPLAPRVSSEKPTRSTAGYSGVSLLTAKQATASTLQSLVQNWNNWACVTFEMNPVNPNSFGGMVVLQIGVWFWRAPPSQCPTGLLWPCAADLSWTPLTTCSTSTEKAARSATAPPGQWPFLTPPSLTKVSTSAASQGARSLKAAGWQLKVTV